MHKEIKKIVSQLKYAIWVVFHKPSKQFSTLKTYYTESQDIKAGYMLGLFYFYGIGVTQDRTYALELLQCVTTKANDDSLISIYQRLKNNDPVFINIVAKNLKESQNKLITAFSKGILGLLMLGTGIYFVPLLLMQLWHGI